MGARTDFEPLTWEEAEQNRRRHTRKELAGVPASYLSAGGVEESGVQAALATMASEDLEEGESAQEQCERLRSELKRGKEYLAQVEKDLAESRAHLEEWPTYERNCGRNPLAHLTQSVVVNERIAQFLGGWLKRRETKLEALSRKSQSAR